MHMSDDMDIFAEKSADVTQHITFTADVDTMSEAFSIILRHLDVLAPGFRSVELSEYEEYGVGEEEKTPRRRIAVRISGQAATAGGKTNGS